MQYYIIGADGHQYGPVEMSTLMQWAHDGRVVPRTTVIESESGRRFLACDIADLTPVFDLPLVGALPHQGGQLTPGTSQYAENRPPAVVTRLASNSQLTITPPAQIYAPNVYLPTQFVSSPRSKTAAGLLGILLGMFGAHRFYLGYNAVGVVMLLITLCTCFIGTIVTAPWGIVEGILCLTGSLNDADGRPLSD